MRTCYKVVAERGYHLYSVNYETLTQSTVIYPVGRWAKGKSGPLLCFGTFADAFQFQFHVGKSQGHDYLMAAVRSEFTRPKGEIRNGYQLWLAEGDNQRELPRYRLRLGPPPSLSLFGSISEWIAAFWQDPRKYLEGSSYQKSSYHRTMYYTNWPVGTQAFEQIRLLTRVM